MARVCGVFLLSGLKCARSFVAASLVLVSAHAWAQTGPEAVALHDTGLSPSADIAALQGLPIARIAILQTGKMWRSHAEVSSIRVGDKLNNAFLRRAARELLSSGGFASVDIQAQRSAEGVDLRFLVVPQRAVQERRLIGSPFDESDVWHADESLTQPMVTEQDLERLGEAVRKFHEAKGYPNAKVAVDIRETDDAMRVVLVLEVQAGDPVRIGTRRIILPEALRPDLEEFVDGYGKDKGDLLDEATLHEADAKLADQLKARAYIQANVSHRVVAMTNGYALFVYVNPGPKTRLRFEGNHLFDADQLADAIDWEKETDRSPSRLAGKVRSFYRSMGLLDVVVEVSERGQPTEAINEIVFKIREGSVVRVEDRSYPCLSGPRPSREVSSEIDSFLEEQLPGSELLSAVNPKIVDDTYGPTTGAGTRPAPLELDPTRTFVPEVYDRAVKHLQDLYRSEGYLSASVGPVQIVRARCNPKSPVGQCIPMPLPRVSSACSVDSSGLPEEEPEPDPRLLCHPDMPHGLYCSPKLSIRIPIKLGPRAQFYDLAFGGNRLMVESKLAEAAAVELGQPASNVELEQARRRVLDLYREYGFAYAEVRASLTLSPDHTRARAHFAITEGEQVVVDRIVVEGAVRTSESLILRRVLLERGSLYRQSLVRKTEERLASLGVFSTVSVGLQDPHVPAKRKSVVVRVQERLPQYLDLRPGFSTGEGMRVQFEYGHRNIGGKAIQFTVRLRLGYLPDAFILDSDVRRNLDKLPVGQRLERRNTVSVLFPEVGLGPLFSIGVDGIDVRSNARDFGLTKNALSPSLNYRPVREVTSTLGASFERNDVAIFNGETVAEYLSRPGVTPDLGRLLRVPDGLTYAIAQRLNLTWDRRDNPFGATRGTLLGGTVEHVRAFPANDNPNTKLSDSMKMTGVVAGYVRLSRKGLAFAASVRGGYIYQLIPDAKTYPDRLFFLGGVDTIRGFLQDSVIPQDVAELISVDSLGKVDSTELTVQKVGIRGGDVYVNPRAEFRIPVAESIQTALFLDTGNVWVDPKNFRPLLLRYAAGTGIRIVTPIGPIALDYGINLDRRAWEDFGAFHFSIGLF